MDRGLCMILYDMVAGRQVFGGAGDMWACILSS